MKIAKKITICTALILILIVVIVLVVCSFYFYSISVARGQKAILNNSPDLNDYNTKEKSQPTPVSNNANEWLKDIGYETITITTYDNLKLCGYYIPAKTPTTKTVILAHGYTSRGKDMGTFARFFHEQLGYNVLLPDDRGHGKSEGDYIGFGWPDRKDYLKWIDFTIEKVGSDVQIALLGVSMGGATVMMVSGEQLPKQVKAIIEDCGYTSVADQLSYQLKRMYHLPAFPIINTTSLLTQFRAGYSFFEASSLKQVKKAKVPMMFIHGDSDTFVPSNMVYQLYDACPTQKELWVVEGAGHGLSYFINPQAYIEKVDTFLLNYIH